MRRTMVSCVLVSLCFASSPVSAQRIHGRTTVDSAAVESRHALAFEAVDVYPSTASEQRVARQIFGGLVFGGLGALGGWLAGRTITGSPGGGLIGAAVVEIVALPYGVHWGNGRRGDFPLAFLASYGLGLAGAAVTMASWTDSAVLVVSLAVPAAQLAASIAIERSTSGSDAGRDRGNR